MNENNRLTIVPLIASGNIFALIGLYKYFARLHKSHSFPKTKKEKMY